MFPITAFVGAASLAPPVMAAAILAAPDLAAPTGVGAANDLLADAGADDETSGTAAVDATGSSTSPSLPIDRLRLVRHGFLIGK